MCFKQIFPLAPFRGPFPGPWASAKYLSGAVFARSMEGVSCECGRVRYVGGRTAEGAMKLLMLAIFWIAQAIGIVQSAGSTSYPPRVLKVAASSPGMPNAAALREAEKQLALSEARKEKRHIKIVLVLFAVAVLLLFILALYLGAGRRRRSSFASLLLMALGLLGAVYMAVAVYYDLQLGYTKGASKAGISVASVDHDPFLFYATVAAKAAVAAFLVYLSLRSIFQNRKA